MKSSEETEQQSELAALRAKVQSLRMQRTFVQGILSEIELGLWTFELDEGVPPRMYGNAAMDALIGCEGDKITPEEYYCTWYGRVDEAHRHAVKEVVDRIIAGDFAEVTYPYHHPTRGVMQVVCGGRRDLSYTKGIRIVGRHQDISELVNIRARAQELEIVQATAENEHDRANKATCINESLNVLSVERDFSTALQKIMSMWCQALGAQGCYVGRWDRDCYRVVQSYVIPGEVVPYEPGKAVEYLSSFNDAAEFHGGNDYVPMVDFRNSFAFNDFVRVASHPEAVRQIASCYSHVIRCEGVPWGTLVLYFRERHPFTENEKIFLKAAVRSIELSLIRQRYEDEIALERVHEAEVERTRADRQHRINETLEILLAESDLKKALGKIMEMWCESLGAQWCYIGECKGHNYQPVYGYAMRGEKPLCDIDAEKAHVLDGDEIFSYHEDSDYLAMSDFQLHPLAKVGRGVFLHSETAAQVSSCYSHVIHLAGRRWGTLVLMFRERREFSPHEASFFMSSVKGIELALERHRALARIECERDRALVAEKAKSLFFSSVSHDIRTPLNAIVGFSELLQAGVPNKADHDRYISTIRCSGKMLARLVNDILDLSKLESGRLEIINEPTDIPALVREVVAAFEVTRVRTGIELGMEVAPMPRISIDPQRIRQILYNLLSNAYKYTSHGRVFLKTTWKDGTFAFSVTDTGKGILKKDIARIFQPFVQIVDRNHRDGTGLGLPICQHLAHLMGGELRIESEIGKGSTFSVVIPGVKALAVEPTACVDVEPSHVSVEEGPAVVRARRVLAVDDSSVNPMVLKAMLIKCGVAEVVTAANGRQALDILGQDAAFDAVLTDLWMPEMDGEQLVRAIRERSALAHLPVYLVTADVESSGTYHKQGFTGILIKPISQARVRAILG